jgi:hypothetical protein
MKLKCDTHNRRVLTLNNKFAHRTGDLSKCDSPTATIGDRKYAIEGGTVTQIAGEMQVDLNQNNDPDAEKLLRAIFGESARN